MISETLEEDLQSYAKRRSQKVFKRIYEPLTYILKWLVSKQYPRIAYSNDFQDLQQAVFLKLHKYIPCYKQNKGMTAVSYVRMLMSQEITFFKITMDKHYQTTSEYDESIDNRQYDFNHGKTVKDYQLVLMEYSKTVEDKLKPIVIVIAESLTSRYVKRLDYTKRLYYYSKKSGMSLENVTKAIQVIKKAQLGRNV